MKRFIVLLGFWLAFHVTAADGDWLNVLQGPLARAKAENKLVLVDFSGSDWCSWCQKLQAEILDTPEFMQYAKSNLILVTVDFPRQTPLPEPLKKANDAWQKKFQTKTFPTVVLINSDCLELGRQSGFPSDGPAAFLEKLNGWRAKSSGKNPAALELMSISPSIGVFTPAGGVKSVIANEAHWLADFPQAQAKALAENKMVLLDFTGSDWCGWCIKLKQEVFSQPQFIEYAKKNLVLVEVDFPRRKFQNDAQKTANARLAQQYNIEGYPTVIVLNSAGQKIGMSGYEEGGPKAYIALLEAMKK